MNRGRRIAAAAAAAFLIVLIARFPAKWAAGALPRGTACAQLAGTLWSGSCSDLVVQGAPLGDVTWTAHPLRLLIGKLSLTVSLGLPSGNVTSRLDLSPGGGITAANLRAAFPLSRALLTQLPPNVQGLLQIDLPSLHWNGRRVTAIRGNLNVLQLAVHGESLGDYRVSFPAGPGAPADEPTGRLQDLGGPLSVQGTLRLTQEPGWALNMLVAPRASAPHDIVQNLRFLGSPDAQGRRPFSLSGTF